MKNIMGIVGVIFTLIFFSGILASVNAEPQCPEGQWYNPELRKCVVPGDGDPETEREFRRVLRAQCYFPCGDGWCCPNEYSCPKCDRLEGKNKTRCYKKLECWKR